MSNPLSFYGGAVSAKGYTNFAGAGTAVFECAPKQDTRQPPTVVPVVLNWSDYINAAATAAPLAPVSINLQGGVTGSPVDSVRSIKINNLGCGSPCTVFFPDTGDEVICAPYSTTRSNVLTGGFQAIVYMPIDTTNLGKATTIYFANFNMDPGDIQDTTIVENLEQASGAPFSLNFLKPRAKGDRWQRVSLDLSLTGSANKVPLFSGPPNGYNFVTLSEIHFHPVGCYSAGANVQAMNVSIVDDLGAVQQAWLWYARNDIDEFTGMKEVITVVNTQNLYQSYIGPTTFRKYFLQNNFAATGFGTCDLVYTLINTVNF